MADAAKGTKGAKGAEKETKEPGPFAVLRPYVLPVDESATQPATDGESPAPDGDAETTAPVLFELVGEFIGKTSKQAIGQAVAKHGGGEYVAVPKRSFAVRKVESVGVPRLKWS